MSKTHEFKVGDTVRVVDAHDGRYDNGDEGIVTEIYGDGDVWVKFPNLGKPVIVLGCEIEHTSQEPEPSYRAGILFRWASCWIGAHWSDHNRRLCINPLPFVTVWVALPGGKVPA